MNFEAITKDAHPAYTWLWNTTITKDGIREQLLQMYEAGIRAFYIIGEPENFRPSIRRTHLSPEYLSQDYLELVAHAWSVAEELGMEMWLYNEGGFPSGMVCGKIREQHPELAIKELEITDVQLAPNTAYISEDAVLAAFVGDEQIQVGSRFDEAVMVTEYRQTDGVRLRTDNASLKNTELFLKMTHEALKAKLGEAMGTRIRLMFDDEAYMGTWTEGYEKIFFEAYGYDVRNYLPYISGRISPVTDRQYRAVSDYMMLCGDLVRNHYFIPMKQWLNANCMLSTGHLDRDNFSHGCRDVRYGNVLKTLRAFDVPGIDVIWSQISFPKEGSCCFEGYPFFPRVASSAANQCGHSIAMSESFAVYGAQVTPELMRFAVNYQAVRGISLFNFMVISYDRKTPMCLQYRPNFNNSNPGMDCLAQINAYTARLSDILQKGRPDISTALYFPFRSICAGGKKGKEVEIAFETLGKYLEDQGVSFDLIDEDFVLTAKKQNGALIGKYVRYDHVFVPDAFLEKEEVLQKLDGLNKQMEPCILRQSKHILARKILFSEEESLYLICNFANEAVSETVGIPSGKCPYLVDLQSGELLLPEYEQDDAYIKIPVTLLRGEAVAVYLTDRPQSAKQKAKYEPYVRLQEFRSCVSREYRLNVEYGPQNTYPKLCLKSDMLSPWDPAFSGEVTYLTTLPELPEEDLQLSLGQVNHFAKVYLNGEKIAECTMPPYNLPLHGAKAGDELKIVVANTIANVCAHTDYFNRQDIRDVGIYHANMKRYEADAPAGGLLGPVMIMKRVDSPTA